MLEERARGGPASAWVSVTVFGLRETSRWRSRPERCVESCAEGISIWSLDPDLLVGSFVRIGRGVEGPGRKCAEGGLCPFQRKGVFAGMGATHRLETLTRGYSLFPHLCQSQDPPLHLHAGSRRAAPRQRHPLFQRWEAFRGGAGLGQAQSRDRASSMRKMVLRGGLWMCGGGGEGGPAPCSRPSPMKFR